MVTIDDKMLVQFRLLPHIGSIAMAGHELEKCTGKKDPRAIITNDDV